MSLALALALIVLGWFDVAPKPAALPACRIRPLTVLERRRIHPNYP